MRLDTILTSFEGWWYRLPPVSRRVIQVVVVVVGLTGFIFINIFAYRYGAGMVKKTASSITASLPYKTPTSTPTPTPLPEPFKTRGKLEYIINSGGGDGPKITQCFIDPLDFTTAKTMTFGVSLENSLPITSATVTWVSDAKEKVVPLKLATGSATKGQWQGTWDVDDTAWYRYLLVIAASYGVKTNKKTVTVR